MPRARNFAFQGLVLGGECFGVQPYLCLRHSTPKHSPGALDGLWPIAYGFVRNGALHPYGNK